MNENLIAEATNLIIEVFRRQGARPGHIFNTRAVMTYPHMEELAEAFKRLQAQGLIDENEALTELGFQKIY